MVLASEHVHVGTGVALENYFTFARGVSRPSGDRYKDAMFTGEVVMAIGGAILRGKWKRVGTAFESMPEMMPVYWLNRDAFASWCHAGFHGDCVLLVSVDFSPHICLTQSSSMSSTALGCI